MTAPLSIFPNFGHDLSCLTDEDVAQSEVSGLTCLLQALVRRLQVAQGTLIGDPNYGYDLIGEIDDEIAVPDAPRIANLVDAEFVKDERVLSSRSTVTVAAAGAAGGQQLTLSTVVVTAAGPFQFVLGIGDIITILSGGAASGLSGLGSVASFPPPGSLPAPAGFSPLSIAGCVLWLNGGAGITLNGSNVSAWADQSGSGNNFTQGTPGSQPLFQSSGINGLPTVTGIASSNRVLNCANVGTSIGISTAGTRFIVVQETLPSGNQPYEQFWGTGSSLDYLSFSGSLYSGFANSTRYNFANTFNASTTYIIEEKSAAGAYSVAINGSVVFTSGTNTVAMSASSPQFLFSQAASTNLVSIAEVLVYNTALGTTNETNVYNYLFGKYA